MYVYTCLTFHICTNFINASLTYLLPILHCAVTLSYLRSALLTEVVITMTQYVHAEKYESSKLERYADNTETKRVAAFLFPAIEEFCKS